MSLVVMICNLSGFRLDTAEYEYTMLLERALPDLIKQVEPLPTRAF